MINKAILEGFEHTILKHNLKEKKFLLAISGGVDSMVLLYLFKKMQLQFEVAHCNFQLRGADSDMDETFVIEYCKENNIKYHTIRFDVEAYQKTGNFSLEMACRNLRYQWFKEIILTQKLNYLVTAHHLDDNIETFIINLSRGTGLKGLTGMQELNNDIFRPLLSVTKNDIVSFAKNYLINWREDYTNKTDWYTRNKIRHHITPKLLEIHPNFYNNFVNTLQNINSAENFISQKIEEIRHEIFTDEDYVEIEINKLNAIDNLDFVQYHLFKKYGFNDVSLINKLKKANNSSELTSATHRLIKNRDVLILSKINVTNEDEIIIDREDYEIKSLNLRIVKSNKKFSEAKEIVNADKLVFPLKIRNVKPGDYFYPLGMDGQKKLISKYFKDLKLSKIEKENTKLLVDKNDRIIWVIGKRLDHRFRLENKVENYLNIILC